MPKHALFDLNGTLFDPSAIGEPLPGDADREGFVAAVLADAVLQGAVETITGSYRDFGVLLRAAAERRLREIGAEGVLDAVVEGSRRMRPFPDAAEAIETLRGSSIPVGVLTNSSEDTARGLISGAGLELDPVVGTDKVGAFKPDARVYERAVHTVGGRPDDVILITAHWWDAVGAKRAGLRAAWVSHRERARIEVEPAPDYEGPDLVSVARLIASS